MCITYISLYLLVSAMCWSSYTLISVKINTFSSLSDSAHSPWYDCLSFCKKNDQVLKSVSDFLLSDSSFHYLAKSVTDILYHALLEILCCFLFNIWYTSDLKRFLQNDRFHWSCISFFMPQCVCCLLYTSRCV